MKKDIRTNFSKISLKKKKGYGWSIFWGVVGWLATNIVAAGIGVFLTYLFMK